MATTSKTNKLVTKLQSGKRLTVAQIMHHCGFAHRNSVYGTISRLRREGYQISSTTNRSGEGAYQMV